MNTLYIGDRDKDDDDNNNNNNNNNNSSLFLSNTLYRGMEGL